MIPCLAIRRPRFWDFLGLDDSWKYVFDSDFWQRVRYKFRWRHRGNHKSGSNHFHGSLFELHRDAALEARNYFDLSSGPIPPFVRNQFGASIGGPLARDHTFFFASYEGFREVRASTAIATVPDALAHRGLLPAANDPSACTSASPSGCVSVATDPRVQPFLALLPPSNGADNGDGTGDLITADKGATYEHHGMVRLDHNFSSTHSLFGRYSADGSSSFVPYFGTPPELMYRVPVGPRGPESVLHCAGS